MIEVRMAMLAAVFCLGGLGSVKADDLNTSSNSQVWG